MKITKEMLGAAHDIMLQRGDFVLSANLLSKIYCAMRNREPLENRELLEQQLAAKDAAIALYNQALLAAFPEGASGEVFRLWNAARKKELGK
jgi:hypothetical protein